MGNSSFIEKVTPEIEKIKNLIVKEDYKSSYYIYSQILKDIKINNYNEKDVKYLLSNIDDYKKRLKFETIIGNLKNKHKLLFLFQLIYEQYLIDSIDKIESNKKNNNKVIDKEENLEVEKEEIFEKIKKMIKLKEYITHFYSKSILYEKMAEKYYDLGVIKYSIFKKKNGESSEELQEIITSTFSECIANYKESLNYQELIDFYDDVLKRVTAHQQILFAYEKINLNEYMEAKNIFEKINYNNEDINTQKKNGIDLCYKYLAEKEEQNKNYEKALDYFKIIKNKMKIYEMNLLINEAKITQCITEKQYDNIFEYFSKIFTSYNETKEILELKYSQIYSFFIEVIVKLSLIYYKNNELKKYIDDLEKYNTNQEETKLIITELIQELKNIEQSNSKDFYEKLKIEILNPKNSEIKERLYLSFLLIKYFKENSFEIIEILLNNNSINLSYLSNEAFGNLKQLLKEIKIDYLDELFLISKLFYKIIVLRGLLFNNLDCLNIIGNKVKEIYEIPNLTEINKLNDSIEYLIFSFQEILINIKKIKSYISPKNLLLSLILKNNKFINCISRGLLFLSQKNMIFEKEVLNILKNYLIKNENDNLLQCLIMQYKFQPNILSDNISDLYDILFFYQKINNPLENNIFDFLLELNNEILSSKTSILCLEKYGKENNINPLFYSLIEKIPVKNRGIFLSQQYLNYKEKKLIFRNNTKNDNSENQLAFKLYFEKEDLLLIENRLNDEKITQKLINSLKYQNSLFEFLNIEKISKSFSLSKKELFILLIENKVNFNEKSLINLLQGFYKNNEDEVKETFNIFNKIKDYQNNFSMVIQTNLNLEEYLFEKKYLTIEKFNNELLIIFNDFSFLFGFAEQHQKFILYILNLPFNDSIHTIIEKMIEFLIEKKYDIGGDIFKKILKEINQKKFIEILPCILSNKNISNEIKSLTLKDLYTLIKKNESNENKLMIFKKFKLFIDWIKLPDIFLKYFISYLKKEKNEKEELNKEIIYFLGIYFSISKVKQEKFLDDLINIFEEKELFLYLKKHVETIKKKNEIFYLFSCLNYTEFSLNNKKEEEILKIPKEFLVNYIINNLKELNKVQLETNISYMESYFNFCNFSPKRDQILRKLFFNDNTNAVNNLKLICC